MVLDRLLRTFIWGTSRHKLAWKHTQKPTKLGGLAVLDFAAYYLAAQLSHCFPIDKGDHSRYLALVCQPAGACLPHPFCDILRGVGGSPTPLDRGGIRFHHGRVWDLALSRRDGQKFHTMAPLWFNRHPPELLNYPDPGLWLSKYIYLLSHLVLDGAI